MHEPGLHFEVVHRVEVRLDQANKSIVSRIVC